METKENLFKCRGWFDRKHKKALFIIGGIVLLAIVALSIAAAGWKMREARKYGYGNIMYGYDNAGRGQMMYGRKGVYPIAPDVNNQFVLPNDALKNGEIAVIVSNLEEAKKTVADVATKNEGNVYATFISYVSRNVKNGSIVVQVPAEKFDATFADLKKIGSKVVQESTQQIPVRSIYPVPMSTGVEKPADLTPVPDVSASVSSDVISTQIAKPEIAIYPNPNQQVQDKGYIKIVFVDYGSASYGGGMMRNNGVFGNIIPMGNAGNQFVRNNMLVIVGIKLLVLVVILVLLLLVFKRMFSHVRLRKQRKHGVHVARLASTIGLHESRRVRQMPKTRTRIVRIQKRK